MLELEQLTRKVNGPRVLSDGNDATNKCEGEALDLGLDVSPPSHVTPEPDR